MKKLILFLIFLGTSFAQNTGQNVINKNVIPTQVLSGVLGFVSPPIQNIGQSSHILKIVVTNFTIAYSLTAAIQGSEDGLTYFNIGPTCSAANLLTNYVLTCTGTQSYPYIRTSIGITVNAGGTIILAASYTGNSSPAIVQIDGSNNISNTTNTTAGYTLPITNQTLGSIAVAPTVQEVVYGLDLFLPSTATHFNFHCSVSTGISILAGDTPGTWAHIQEAVNIRPFGTCPQGESLQVDLAGTGTAYLTIVQRYE